MRCLPAIALAVAFFAVLYAVESGFLNNAVPRWLHYLPLSEGVFLNPLLGRTITFVLPLAMWALLKVFWRALTWRVIVCASALVAVTGVLWLALFAEAYSY